MPKKLNRMFGRQPKFRDQGKRPGRFTKFLLTGLVGVLSATSGAARNSTLADVRKILQAPEIEGLYARTYYSLIDRIDPDGFFQESLTGRYPGMFPRTVGAMVPLLLETGELDLAEKIINCTLEAMTANEMERIPHVFLRQKNDLLPVFNNRELMQNKTPTKLQRLVPGCAGALAVTAPAQPILAVETAIDVSTCNGILTLSLREQKDSEPLAQVTIQTKDVLPGQLWLRFNLNSPLQLEPNQQYFLRVDYTGFSAPIWFGQEQPENASGLFWREASAEWKFQANHAPAYAIDVGNLRHEPLLAQYQIYCDWDQIDGQAHVIMAWADLARQRGRTEFEDRTYPLMATLMDRTSDQPYFMWARGHAISLNLVQNIGFEHSREGRYWHVWDLLTQCVVGSALESMIEIANSRGDSKHALRWRDRMQVLKKGVQTSLTRQVNGKTIYLEMRRPDSAGGVPFLGMGWVNFAPIMAHWEPLDRSVLQNTVAVLREKLVREFHGQKYLAMEFNEAGNVSNYVIGKGVGWEMEYSRQEQEYSQIFDRLEFLRVVHRGELYMESMSLENGQWIEGDGGNGEQCGWWCWALARLRKAAGLPAVPPR
jgi:hypothetical protein